MGVQRDQHCGAHIHVIRKNGLRIQEVRWGAPVCCFELAIAMSVCFQNCEGMRIAPLGLAGGRSYDRTNSLRTPTMKESQLLREKTTSSVFASTCSNVVHAQFHWLAHTHATPGHVTSFACSRNTSDRSLAWSHHRRRSTRAIDRDRSETWNTSGKPHAVACCTSRSTGMQ